MPPARLVEEVAALAAEGQQVELVDSDGMACVLFHGYPLPRGYNKTSTELLLRLPPSYPNGKPDMFWVEPDVLLANGSAPLSGDSMETYMGRQWRRFSWHLASWNPARDDLRTYVEFVNRRLAKGV